MIKKLRRKIKLITYRFVKANGLSAVTAAIVIVVFVAVTKDMESLFDLSFFTSILFAIILEGIAHFTGSAAMNWLEDSVKLTTDYEKLMKSYPKADWYWYGDEKNKFPIVLEGFINGVDIQIKDDPEKELYQLPEVIKDNYDEIIAAHDTSSTYNRFMIRVDDWKVERAVFQLETSRTTYYDSLVTNRAIDYKWKNGMSVRNLFEYGPFLNDLKESKLSNHLGYNGFIESSDGYIVFIKRSKAVSIGKGTYGDSVGASLKTEYALNENKIFDTEGLRRAIVAEIEKEVGVKENQLDGFTLEENLIAAYREFVEGGKPQLMFYAKSTLTKDKITNNFLEKNKRKPKTEIEKVSIDGKVWKWIEKKDLLQAEITASMMKCNGKKYTMMPSSSACVAMLVQHLKGEEKR